MGQPKRLQGRGEGGEEGTQGGAPPQESAATAEQGGRKDTRGLVVDFAFFPVFDDGPGEPGDWKASQGEPGESPAAGTAGRRKSTKEVPDLAGWSTCFTLLQVAWASSKPEMWVPLAAYREVIFKLAKRHQWSQVARYDRRFRQEAAGKDDVRWDEENLSLLLDIVHTIARHRERWSRGGEVPVFATTGAKADAILEPSAVLRTFAPTVTGNTLRSTVTSRERRNKRFKQYSHENFYM